MKRSEMMAASNEFDEDWWSYNDNLINKADICRLIRVLSVICWVIRVLGWFWVNLMIKVVVIMIKGVKIGKFG